MFVLSMCCVGAKPDIPDVGGFSPLINAAFHGHFAVARCGVYAFLMLSSCLLLAGADVGAKGMCRANEGSSRTARGFFLAVSHVEL